MVKTFAHLIEDGTYYFDANAAQEVIEFIEQLCKLAVPYGEPFILLPWQRQILLDVHGWKRRDNNERRFTNVYIEVPRKNGKTYLLAAWALFLLMADGVNAAEVYAAACTREQSGILFKSIRRMIDQQHFFNEQQAHGKPRLYVVPNKSLIEYGKTDSFIKALSGESVGSHGKYPSAVICDELHEWKGHKADELYEALTSGFGQRKSPLTIHITTAGFGSEPTIAKRLHEKAKSFEANTCVDPNFYGVVYGLDTGEDWTDDTKWPLANPSWEMARDNLYREFAAAKSEASKENTFKRLYLNMWTQQQTRWLNMDQWKACTKKINYEDYKGKQRLLVGVDLSQIDDLTAVGLIFVAADDHWTLFVRCYMPQTQVEPKTKSDGIPYDQWVKAGLVIPTVGRSKGVTVDYDEIAADIIRIAEENKVVQVGYDPAGFHHVKPLLEERGVECMAVNQYYSEMSPGSREFERRLKSGEITIAANPCLEWQAGNVEIKHDDSKIRPVKPNSKGAYGGSVKLKVDGIVAAVIASQMGVLFGGTLNEKEEDDGTPAVFAFYM